MREAPYAAIVRCRTIAHLDHVAPDTPRDTLLWLPG